MNTLKTLLQQHKVTYGCWVTLAHPLIPEILSRGGFDWLAIDMEHSSIELKDVLSLVISTQAQGMTPLVRVGENNANLIKRVMDTGAAGVIVPNICSAKEAKQAVCAVKYPPLGTRGVGLYRAQQYGVRFEEYKKWLAKDSVVIIQIEHIDAVHNIDEIFSTQGIDAFIIGPYDLSGSMGKPGALYDQGVQEAINKVLQAAKRYHIVPGYHCVPSDPKEVIKRRKQGFKFLGYCIDGLFLGDMVSQSVALVKKESH